MIRSLASFALAASFTALAAGCAVAPAEGDGDQATSSDDALIYRPLTCIGQISGQPIYRDSGFTSGKDGPNIATVRATLPSCAFRTWSSLWVKPFVESMSGNVVSTGYDMVRLTSGQPIEETIDGLTPTTVYRVRLDLFTISGGQFTQVGSTPDYITVTDGTDDLSRARSAIVLHGLKQFDDQQKGLVGAHGVQVDGTRYTADPGEEWCTEFYAWVTSLRLTTTPYVQSYVGAMESYFTFLAAWQSGGGNVRHGAPGDYMSMNNHQHSTMFLGYDPTTDYVTTLEGNTGDDVGINYHRPSEFDGLGQIRSIMLRP